MEIEKILVSYGSRSIFKDYNDKKLPIALSFVLSTGAPVRLPADPEQVLKIMEKGGVRRGLCTADQAYRVAWRIIKDWVEAQIALLETGQVKMDQIFLPYIETKSGKTVYQIYQDQQHKLLALGEFKSDQA